MIIVKSRGGLGNQLFQLAFAIKVARILKTYFLIQKLDMPFDLKYFKLNCTTNRKIAISLFLMKWSLEIPVLYRFLIKIGLSKTKKNFSIENNAIPIEAGNLNTNHSMYQGFFQSELYFKDFSEEISNLYSIRRKYQKLFSSRYPNLEKRKYGVIQMRRTDYLQSGSVELGGIDLSLPDEFYKEGLNKIRNHHELNIIYVISDDIEFASQLFSSQSDLSIENNNQIVDFQLLLNADVLLISNSTFAWWAAYLNKQKNKAIYCPKYWLGHKVKREYPNSIIPDNWIQLDYAG